MALLHRAELRPSKLELVGGWLPSQPWYTADGASWLALTRVAAFRFDDPDGRVGMETLLVRPESGGLYQVPLTYRDAPLAGAERWLIGTMEHSVLGTRYTYDAGGDPVHASALALTILTGASEAELFYEVDGRRETKPSDTHVWGSGDAAEMEPLRAVEPETRGATTQMRAGPRVVAIERMPLAAPAGSLEPGEHELVGTWEGQPTPVRLATAR
ncbi:hypothetical protein OSC27_03805 [Microbacterium sp. STN6]|uniref:CG0192-related protein n=1 Tax=Microbacterium sp. STN6 TaxID=2995588 RepID=UPI0022609176|nr:hypothetical protein [Microbacterium sp. STN6]MCX7521400.1 hypothetical protein [Microbacterium sp. STN6]